MSLANAQPKFGTLTMVALVPAAGAVAEWPSSSLPVHDVFAFSHSKLAYYSLALGLNAREKRVRCGVTELARFFPREVT